MRNYLLLPLLLFILATSCKKASVLVYDSPDNIYFDFASGTNDRDSIVYTFAYDPTKATDTIFIPVRIAGQRVRTARSLKVQVVTQGTTALAGTHFEPFKESYTIAPDSGKLALPVILYNKDPELTQQSVTLRFALVATPDFGLNLTGLTTGKIVFSSRLEKPEWWEMWLGAYYSQVKHELFLLSSGAVHLTQSGLDAPKNLYHVGRLNSLLNDPFRWVQENAQAGYQLTQKDSQVYEFFNSSNPAKKFQLRRNAQSGKYFFIDEKGQEVI